MLKHECFQGAEFEDEQISVADGLLTVKPGFQWRSFSMGFHAPLVFFGLARMGVIDKVFVYGQPWTIEHSLLRAVLLQYLGTFGKGHGLASIGVRDLGRDAFNSALANAQNSVFTNKHQQSLI